MAHFVPDIKHRIQLVKQVHVVKCMLSSACCQVHVGLIVCSRLPTNERKQLGPKLCNVQNSNVWKDKAAFPRLKQSGHNSSVWKNKVRIPMFGKKRSEFQYLNR